MFDNTISKDCRMVDAPAILVRSCLLNLFPWRITLKALSRLLPLLIICALLFTACGYHNPYVYTGPERVIYIKNWKNRTNELGLDSKLYQSLVRWYQKSASITITKKRAGADLILAGEIVSIELPSLSYGSNSSTTEVKLKLKTRYVLQEISSGKILIEQPGEMWSQDYLVGSSATETSDNQDQALDVIIDDLSQKIYQRTLVALPQL